MILKKTKIRGLVTTVSLLSISLVLTGCTMGPHVQKNLNVIKDRLQVKEIESIIYEREGGDSFSGGGQYDILYSDLAVYDTLKEKLLKDGTLDCFENRKSIGCKTGTIRIGLSIIENESQSVERWNEPAPYVALVMYDSSGGR